jgi:hypothetical protein
MRVLNYIELDTSSSSRTFVYSIPILPAMKSSPRSRSRIQRGLSLWLDPRIRHSRETSASRSPSFRRRISPWHLAVERMYHRAHRQHVDG